MARDDSHEYVDFQNEIVFDFHPQPFSFVMTDELEHLVEEEFSKGTPADEVYFDIVPNERARQFRRDPDVREQFYEYFETAGVNFMAVSLIGSAAHGDSHGWSAMINDIRRYQTMIDSVDWLSKSLVPGDVAPGEVNLLLGVQNATAIGSDIDRLDQLYDFGLRWMQLTYNNRNLLGDGCTERSNAGLSNFGVDVVERMNELGVIVDLSHCGRTTTLDGIEVSEAPPAFTHITCEGVHEHPRAKSDEELQAIAEADGFVGINVVPEFLGDQDIETFVDHVDYAVDIVGKDRVGIATDWGISHPETPDVLLGGLVEWLEGMGFDEDEISLGKRVGPMTEYPEWQELPKALADRGYTRREIRQICGTNFMDYWETV